GMPTGGEKGQPREPKLTAVVPAGVARALLANVASAQADGTCQTNNGPRTTSQIAGELAAAGYPGPWDPDSMAAAYGRATGGAVDCGGTQRTMPATSGVVLVPGINTYSGTPTFALLSQSLHSRGFGGADIWDYSYAGAANTYSWVDTCQDIGLSE